MASIKGIKLTGVQSHIGAEGYTLFANVSMDGKRVGTVCDDAWGGPWSIDIPKEIQAEILERFKTYIKEEHIVDECKTMCMEESDVVNGLAKGNLPLLDTEDRYVDPLELFFSELHDLGQMEKYYKTAVKKGYKAVVRSKFVSTKNGTYPDVIYYTNGSPKAYAECVKEFKKKSYAVIVKTYASLADFTIS